MKHLGYAAAIVCVAISGLAFVVFGPMNERQSIYETDQGAVIWLSEKP